MNIRGLEQKDADRLAEEAGISYADLVRQAPWACLVLDPEGRILAGNERADWLLAGAGSGALFAACFIAEDQDEVLAWLGRVFRQPEAQTIDVRLTLGESLQTIRLTGQVLAGQTGQAAVYLDALTDGQTQGRQLLNMAYYDQLTRLPNRYLMSDRLHWAIRDAGRHQEKIAVLAVDLDHFKRINDSYGHQAGDTLLQQISRKMAACLREADTLARLGGDEFAVIMQHLTGSQDAMAVAGRLLESIRQPVDVMGVPQTMSASIGISLFPEDGTQVQELLDKADIALYRAKNGGRDRIAFFNETMKAAVDVKIDFERRLRLALERGELLLYYQPIIAAQDGRILALEALLRWNSTRDGLLPAMAFLPLAREIGIDRQLADWALQAACGQMQRWLESGLIDGLDSCRLTVNLSDSQLTASDLPERVRQVLVRTGLPAERLILEIHEAALDPGQEQVRDNLEKLSGMSVQLYLDDFCQGFCTLGQAGRIPFTSLKIDQKITTVFLDAPHGEQLLDAMIRLAHQVNLTVIAEGVESERTMSQLLAFGCDALQGYLIGPPLPPAQTEMLLGLNAAQSEIPAEEHKKEHR
ncbi:MAG: EAL domain-containing protein [Clostridiaceae bacterium]|nr:EAL domain-containing protein [Clostridiaceae bacterium]